MLKTISLIEKKIRYAIILYGVAYSSSSKMNLRPHLQCGVVHLDAITARLFFPFCNTRDVTSIVVIYVDT